MLPTARLFAEKDAAHELPRAPQQRRRGKERQKIRKLLAPPLQPPPPPTPPFLLPAQELAELTRLLELETSATFGGRTGIRTEDLAFLELARLELAERGRRMSKFGRNRVGAVGSSDSPPSFEAPAFEIVVRAGIAPSRLPSASGEGGANHGLHSSSESDMSRT